MTDRHRKMIARLQNYVPDDCGERSDNWLSSWEIDFLERVSQLQGELTSFQLARLAGIWGKCFG